MWVPLMNFITEFAESIYLQEEHCWSIWEPHCIYASWAIQSCPWDWCLWPEVQYSLSWSRHDHLFSLLREAVEAYIFTRITGEVIVRPRTKWRTCVSFFFAQLLCPGLTCQKFGVQIAYVGWKFGVKSLFMLILQIKEPIHIIRQC